jgi:COP9 signalosome complex subunit 7
MSALSLSSTVELESLVTTAIYASLISARLSPASTPPTVNVTSVAPLRDVQPQFLPKMVTLLTQWEARCGEVVNDLEAEIARVKENAEKRHAHELEYQLQLDDVTKQRQEALNSSNAMSNGSGRNRPAAWGRRGGPRLGAGMGNKREADDIDHDDGYFESGDGESGSRMDIDEGPGSRGGGSRHSKRVVGRKA